MTHAPMRDERITSDPELAEVMVRGAYGGDVRFQFTGPSPFSLRSVGDDQVSTARLDFPARISAVTPPLKSATFLRVVGGRYRLHAGGKGAEEFLPGDVFSFDPHVDLGVEADGLEIEVMSIDHDVLERTARQLQPLSPRLGAPRSRPVGRSEQRVWLQTANHLTGTIFADDELYANDLIRTAQIAHIAAITIVAFGMLADERDDRPASEETVRRAMRFADEHAGEPITVGDLAAAASKGLRALQLAFRRVLDVTPSAYLRQARLESAHDQLLHDDPGTTTVESVARRWGFAHAGRFAASHRGAFGELPRDTLSR